MVRILEGVQNWVHFFAINLPEQSSNKIAEGEYKIKLQILLYSGPRAFNSGRNSILYFNNTFPKLEPSKVTQFHKIIQMQELYSILEWYSSIPFLSFVISQIYLIKEAHKGRNSEPFELLKTNQK